MELFTPEFGLVFWMFVVFIILFAILAKYAWPYIIRSLDERAELIDKGVEYAQEAKAQLDNAQADAKALLVPRTFTIIKVHSANTIVMAILPVKLAHPGKITINPNRFIKRIKKNMVNR